MLSKRVTVFLCLEAFTLVSTLSRKLAYVELQPRDHVQGPLGVLRIPYDLMNSYLSDLGLSPFFSSFFFGVESAQTGVFGTEVWSS